MKRFFRTGFLVIAVCALSAIAARAQSAIYSTDFPDAQGWTFTGLGAGYPWWDVDATPTNVGGTPSWHSAPFSLNFNNGTNYAPIGDGTATSPPIDLSVASGNPTLAFWCQWDTERRGTPGCGWDERYVQISNNGFQSLLVNACYYKCGTQQYEWHPHALQLQKSWGTIQVRFVFHTVDSSFNHLAGWFVDDLEVTTDCLPSTSYCSPKINSLGCTPLIFTSGNPSLSGSGSAFRIQASNVLNQSVGMLMWSRYATESPFAAGTLCVHAPNRTVGQTSGGTALPAKDCTGTYSFQFTPALMSQAGLIEGNEVFSQYWSRDSGFLPPPYNVGLTAGVRWVVCQ